MAAQIAAMKRGMAFGQYAQGTQGTASSGWGLGTSPYAVGAAPAKGSNQIANRQGDASLGDTATTSFEPLYAPEDFAHGFTSENQLTGQIDLTQTPKKVEEVRSAPEDQESLVEYANIIGAYAEGEESAIQREAVPLEYQELVRQYFDQLKQEAAKGQKSEEQKQGAEPAEKGGEKEKEE